MKSLTLRIPESVEGELARLAEGLDRSKSYVALQALKEYLGREAAFVASVNEGLEAAERGDIASAEEVDAAFAKYREPAVDSTQS